MKLPYRLPEKDEQVKALAVKIVQVILDSGCTYQKADDALTEAQSMLLAQTHPVIGTAPLLSD